MKFIFNVILLLAIALLTINSIKLTPTVVKNVAE